ncbi:MAG: anti-phage defense ZorAB system ZorA [Gammaproteobacteria bacterium]|nr:anti-phage defense ZorAB system ZorA [Gammaproteobacteria bacterium]
MNQLFQILLPWPWRDFNPITDTFVYSIFLFFIICLGIFFWKTILRARLIKILVDQVNQHAHPAKPEILPYLKTAFYGNSELSEVWQEFENSLITRRPKENQEEIVYKTDEASLFFSEERLLGQYMNLRFWNSVPALLVGFGILGTFVGLVGGLIPFSGISFEETGEIRSAIEGLLSGVSTAFVTSVWGMLLSLLFNWIEKSCIGWVSRGIAVLQRGLDQLFTLTTQEEIAFRQEDELAQQTQALKAFSTDLANEIKSAMAQGRQEIVTEFRNAPETFSNAIGEQLTPSLNNLNSAVTNSASNIETVMVKESQQILQQMTNQLVPRLDTLNIVANEINRTIVEGNQDILRELHKAPDAFGNAVAEKFAPSFNNLNSAIEALQRQKAESSTDAIQQLVEEFQRSLSGSASAQMEALAETVRQASESLVTLPQQLASMMIGVQEQVDQTRQLLSESSHDQVEQMKSMMEGMSEAFQNAVDIHQTGLSATTDSINQEMQQIANDIRHLLEEAANYTNTQLAQRMADMENASHQSIQALQTLIVEMQKSMTATASQTTEKSEAMIIQMHRLIDQSTTRLESIFTTAELSVGSLLEQQESQIEEVNAQIANSRETLEKSSEMLQQMDASVSSVQDLLGRTDALSGLLLKNGDKLEAASEQLIVVSEAFTEENAKYLTANRETTEKLQSALGQSQQLLNDFTQRFEKIDAGLQSIFEEIEGGLTNYSTTARESINTYLIDFSNHLTEAAAALNGGVEALTESVDELTDMAERLQNSGMAERLQNSGDNT